MEKKLNLDIKWIVEQEIELSDYNSAREEITDENCRIFVRMLRKHMNLPSSKGVRDTVEENIKILNQSMNVLTKNRNLVYATQDIESLFKIMRISEEYFKVFGLERPIGKQLRKAYLRVNDYLQKIREPLFTEKRKVDLSNPNELYLDSYRKFLTENIKRAKEGLYCKDKPSHWKLDNSENGQIKQLALEDSLRHLRSGIDYSTSRGDLRYSFGVKSRGDLNEETLVSVANQMLNKTREDLVKKIQRLEGVSVAELHTKEEQLVHSLIERAKRNRSI